MNIENRSTNIALEWERAQEALKEASVLLEKKLPNGSISRAYYAALHAARSILLTEGLEPKFHQGAGRLFSLHFVKTGTFEARFARILSTAQKHREEADYTSEYDFTIDEANRRVEDVKEFLHAAEVFLKRKKYF